MIKIHHYSESKFRSFTAAKQRKVILEMLAAIEQNITDPELSGVLITHLQECLTLADQSLSGDSDTPDFSSLATLTPSLTAREILSVITPVLHTHRQRQSDMDYSILKYDGAAKAACQDYRNKIDVYAVLD